MAEDPSDFGTRIRSLRLLAALSQEELAERSGVSVRTIGNLERGRPWKPYRSTCEGLADALGLRGLARAEFVAAARRPLKAAPAVSAERAVSGEPAQQSVNWPSATPRHLPRLVSSFVGRRGELTELARILGPRGRTPSIAVISGSPGVGKTALAVRWAHDAAEQFPDGQIYMDLRGYGPDQPVSPADALASLLRTLGMAAPSIPDGTAERAAIYRGLLADKQVLVVLDNASDSAQVRPLLPGGGQSAVVVTSRDPLAGMVAREGASRLELDVLPADEAVDLLRDLIGARVIDEPRAVAALASYCSQLPLALRVAAELAVARPSLPLATLAGQLADLRHRVGLLDAGGDEHTAVQSVLSWSYRQLDAAVARAFRLLGQHPGSDFDGYAAAALTGTTAEDAGQLLEKLARAYLIQSIGPGRYGMHDLLRAYAREHAASDRPDNHPVEPADQENRAALARLFEYYLQTTVAAGATLFAARGYRGPNGHWTGDSPAVETSDSASAWLDTELDNLVAAAAQMADGDRPDQAGHLASAIFPYLQQSSRVAEAILIEGHALRASRRAADQIAEASALRELGYMYLVQGRYQQATGHLRQATAIFRHAGDQSSEAIALGSLAVISRRLGHYQQAGDQQRRALALARQIGNQCVEAHALMRLGIVDSNRGRYQQALEHNQEALHVSRQIGDPLIEAAALTRLAVVEQHLGRYQEAEERHEMALVLFQRGGDPSGEAEARDGLGELSLVMGQPDDAVVHHAVALQLAEETSDLDEQARALHGLACAHQALGDQAQAQSHFEEALRRFAAVGAPEGHQIKARLSTVNGKTASTLAG